VERRMLSAPAPAPRDQAGAGAVSRAAQEQSLRSVQTASDVAVQAESLDRDLLGRVRSGVNPTQRVGGRLFIQRDSTWTDLAHGDSLRVVTVAPYSDAYFALLRLLPELTASAALEPAVLVAGRRVSIKIGPGGKTRWTGEELERLVREFRG
ncbi:MAG: hypothetical protein ACREI7_10770, partial [Myxococcota bacterium]